MTFLATCNYSLDWMNLAWRRLRICQNCLLCLQTTIFIKFSLKECFLLLHLQWNYSSIPKWKSMTSGATEEPGLGQCKGERVGVSIMCTNKYLGTCLFLCHTVIVLLRPQEEDELGIGSTCISVPGRWLFLRLGDAAVSFQRRSCDSSIWSHWAEEPPNLWKWKSICVPFITF